MKRYLFCFLLFMILIGATTSFVMASNSTSSDYWRTEGIRPSSVATYASSPSAVSLNGLDANVSYEYLKSIYGPPTTFKTNSATYVWGESSHCLCFTIGGYAGRNITVYGEDDIGFSTPDGVCLGMPFTEAQKIYGQREDYAKKHFFVVSPDHSKYMCIYRHFEPNSQGIYIVDRIEVLGPPDKSILDALNKK